jgi:hypothetical protein
VAVAVATKDKEGTTTSSCGLLLGGEGLLKPGDAGPLCETSGGDHLRHGLGLLGSEPRLHDIDPAQHLFLADRHRAPPSRPAAPSISPRTAPPRP